MNLTRWQRPAFGTLAGFGGLTNLRDEIDRLFEVRWPSWQTLPGS